MANHVSSLKRARQTVTRSEVNRANRSRVRTSLRASARGARQGRREGRPGAVSRNRLRSRQERAEGHSPRQHRLPLQEPPERAAKGFGHRQGVARRSRRRSRFSRSGRGQPWPLLFYGSILPVRSVSATGRAETQVLHCVQDDIVWDSSERFSRLQQFEDLRRAHPSAHAHGHHYCGINHS